MAYIWCCKSVKIMNGEKLIAEICELLKKEGRFLTDTNIVNKLRELDYVTFSNVLNGTHS